MIAEITHHGRRFRVDLARPISLAHPLHDGPGQLRAWWVDPVRMEPVQADGKTYAVRAGAPVNFRNIVFNPHGHGTHTESVGHITPEVHPVGGLLKRYFFIAQVVSVRPGERRRSDGRTDAIISLEQLRQTVSDHPPEALVVRTLPHAHRGDHDWSGTNPPYLESTACAWLRSIGVKHLLVDLPSVDREEDDGALAAHHAFWDHPHTVDLDRTITELVHVPAEVRDGDHLLELQLPHFMNDAAPSRPVLYALLP
ncbi:MAG: cyclase family protein [Flavobacteriales bacterium]|jgi:kynurenine formamidase|nr:cyclase family protein [Flavobacteriales bacterium]